MLFAIHSFIDHLFFYFRVKVDLDIVRKARIVDDVSGNASKVLENNNLLYDSAF